MIWGWLIPGWLRRAVIGIGAALIAAVGIFYAGKREARKDAKTDALKRKVETIETVKGLAKDAAKTDDSDLADRITRGR